MATISTWSSESQGYGPGEVRAELHLNDAHAGAYFNLLRRENDMIEAEFGQTLNWDTREGVRSCRIGVLRGANGQDQSIWPQLSSGFECICRSRWSSSASASRH